MADLQRLFNIALGSRVRMETLNHKLGWSDDLHGLCAIAALDLFRALNDAQITTRYAVGWNHCFCLVDDLIIDTTATQFRHADPVAGVWIASSNDPDYIADPGVWRVRAVFETEAEIMASDIWRSWTEAERPHALDNLTQG